MAVFHVWKPTARPLDVQSAVSTASWWSDEGDRTNNRGRCAVHYLHATSADLLTLLRRRFDCRGLKGLLRDEVGGVVAVRDRRLLSPDALRLHWAEQQKMLEQQLHCATCH